MNRPLCLAVCTGSLDVIRILLEDPICDATIVDFGCNNVFHVMTLAIYYDILSSEVVCDIFAFFNKFLDMETCNKLLGSENGAGLRPLELSAQCGCFDLFSLCLTTAKFYLKDESPSGIYNEKMIDITEYETWGSENRFKLCPLYFLAMLEDDKLSKYTL